MHLSIHRKASNSLACDVRFSSNSSHLSMFRSPGFLLQKTPRGPSLRSLEYNITFSFMLCFICSVNSKAMSFFHCSRLRSSAGDLVILLLASFWVFFEVHPLWSPPVPTSICCHCDWIASSELLKRRSINCCHPINILLGGSLSSRLWGCSRSDF